MRDRHVECGDAVGGIARHRVARLLAQGKSEDEVVAAREQLNRTYDFFVAKFGPISERANTTAFRGDPDLPLLLSLECYDRETRRATKAAIFRERTIQRQTPSLSCRRTGNAT